MGNGPTSSALTAPLEEARRGGQKGALWQPPSLPPWKEPDAGGTRALFGCPHCPRGRGQTRGGKRRSLADALPAPGEGGQTRVGNGPTSSALTAPVEEARHGGQKGALWQAPSLPPWKQPDVGGKRARDANLHCPRV